MAVTRSGAGISGRDNNRVVGNNTNTTMVPDVETSIDELDSRLIEPAHDLSHTYAEEVRFLYEAYKPEYWYWEVGTIDFFEFDAMICVTSSV